jgi:hypothetical protein
MAFDEHFLNIASKYRMTSEFLERDADTGRRDFDEGHPSYGVRPRSKSTITGPLTC